MVSIIMTKSIRDSKKSKPKRGRPKTTGSGEPQVVRMHAEQLKAIDAWIARSHNEVSRPTAIRMLVDLGLGVSAGGKADSSKS